jgi:hypothetical protein
MGFRIVFVAIKNRDTIYFLPLWAQDSALNPVGGGLCDGKERVNHMNSRFSQTLKLVASRL